MTVDSDFDSESWSIEQVYWMMERTLNHRTRGIGSPLAWQNMKISLPFLTTTFALVAL